MESRLCPMKETMVYFETCERRCSFSKEKCEAAEVARQASLRQCIDCRNCGIDEEACDECLELESRDRPLWEPVAMMVSSNPPLARPEPVQLSLF